MNSATSAVAPARSTAVTFASWPSIAAIGGGLIQFALGAGAVTSADTSVASRVVGVALLVLGATSIGWGIVLLAKGRMAVPRVGVVGALVGAALVVLGFAIDPVRMSVLAVAPAVALLLVAGVGAAVSLRGERREESAPGRTRIVELIIGAILAAAIVTPALSATEAGYLSTGDGPIVIQDTGHNH